MHAAKQAALPLDASQHYADFAAWCRDVAQKDPEEYQAEIGRSVVEHRTTLVPSCNGAGKSYIAALIIVWWVMTHEDPFVVWTAPRFRQVKKTIGRYLLQVIADLDRRGLNTMRLRITDSQELYAGSVPIGQGVSPADNDENGISGIHATHVLCVVDEADGVAPAIFAALDSYMTTEGSRMLAIGNPHRTSSTFHAKMQTGLTSTRTIRLDGLRLPTMSRSAVGEFPELAAIFERERIPYASEADAKRAAAKNIATPRKYAEWLVEWGEDHPYWHTKVRGVYPPASEYQMFTQEDLDACYALNITPLPRGGKSFGFDIAEQGGDETVGYCAEGGRDSTTGKTGLRIRRVYAKRGGRTPGVTAVRAILEHTHAHHRVAVDANGTGWGVYEQLLDADRDVIAHKGSRSANRPDVYDKRKAEVYYLLQTRMRDGEIDLDPEDEKLAADLLSVRWVPTDTGAPRKVETRKDRIKRGDESPDRADALTITVAYATPMSDDAYDDPQGPPLPDDDMGDAVGTWEW